MFRNTDKLSVRYERSQGSMILMNYEAVHTLALSKQAASMINEEN